VTAYSTIPYRGVDGLVTAYLLLTPGAEGSLRRWVTAYSTIPSRGPSDLEIQNKIGGHPPINRLWTSGMPEEIALTSA
jgi:hypothetical protein